MDENLKSYIKTSAINGLYINIQTHIPIIKAPILKEIGDKLFPYLYLVTKYIDMYELKKDDMLLDIVTNNESILDFTIFLSYFMDCKNISFKNSTFIFDDNHYISFENIDVFMNTIKVLHHRDKKDDNYKPINTLASKMMERARKLKQEVAEKINKAKANKDDGVGFLEIVSTVSARHPSINLLNISDLNYYQILDQYRRLIQIDKYTPCLFGNATEEYAKQTKHYSEKLINE